MRKRNLPVNQEVHPDRDESDAAIGPHTLPEIRDAIHQSAGLRGGWDAYLAAFPSEGHEPREASGWRKTVARLRTVCPYRPDLRASGGGSTIRGRLRLVARVCWLLLEATLPTDGDPEEEQAAVARLDETMLLLRPAKFDLERCSLRISRRAVITPDCLLS